MKKTKNAVMITAGAILFIAMLFFLSPNIERHTWILSVAQKTEAPYSVVAHNKALDFSDDESGLYKFSKPIELICEAKDGRLVLTDKTNGQTYTGTYTAVSFLRVREGRYTVAIDGLEGTATVSVRFNQTLLVSVGGHSLTFEVKRN